jgi:hypothetical protein
MTALQRDNNRVLKAFNVMYEWHRIHRLNLIFYENLIHIHCFYGCVVEHIPLNKLTVKATGDAKW